MEGDHVSGAHRGVSEGEAVMTVGWPRKGTGGVLTDQLCEQTSVTTGASETSLEHKLEDVPWIDS
jgi:hypothetical protein